MTRFRANPRWLGEVKALPGTKEALLEGAMESRDEAKNVAPRGRTPHYVNTIEADVVDGMVVLFTRDPAGHLIEFGSVNNPAYAPLRRGVQAAGYELREAPKGE